MSRIGCWLPLAGAILVVVGCGGTDVGSRWLTGGVIVDGDTDEWSGPGLTYVEELPGAVGAANNDTSLYVMVRFADPNMGRKITVGGATVWWNRNGREKKDIGIRFAPLIDISHPPEQRGGPETPRTDGQGPRGRPPDRRAAGPREGQPEGPLHNLMMLLHDGGEMPLLEGEPGPVAAASAFRAGLYCYEVQIPLQSPGADAWTMKGKPGEEVHVCLELGGVSSETEEAGGEGEVPGERTRGDGGMRPGGGMGPGGMPPGGRGGGRGGPGGMGGPRGMGRGATETMRVTELWCTIRLAEGPADTSGSG